MSAAISKHGLIKFEIKESAYNAVMFGEFIDSLKVQLESMNIDTGKFILDNASIHRSKLVSDKLLGTEFELVFLPAYSPQLNPIEETFSKWKNIIKVENCNTIDELKGCISVASGRITKDDCIKYFSHVRKYILKGIRRGDF